jgi:hypothetical protein
MKSFYEAGQGTIRMQDEWEGKTNNTPKAKKIKKKLEELGHTDVHVWYEQLEPGHIMAGPTGGYCFTSDQWSYDGLGYSFNEAMEMLSDGNYYKVN